MTLDTRVHIAEPTDPEKLFLHLLGLLAADPEFIPAWERKGGADPWQVDPGPLRHGRATYEFRRKGEQIYQKRSGRPLWLQSESQYISTLGQGLGATLEVTYGEDGPLQWPPLDEDFEEAETIASGGPYWQHCVSVSFDTAYGYNNRGANCGDLHAWLVTELGLYLADRGITQWAWQNEYDGSWHALDEIHILGDPKRGALL